MAFLKPAHPAQRRRRQAAIARSSGLVPNPATMVGRIEDIYAQALESEHIDGAGWYPAAYDIARLVGDIGGWSVETGAGIIAALSPQCSWEENIVRALAYARGEETGGLPDGLAKCDRMVAGEHPDDVLGGRKVRSFYRNILLHENAVTVDRHAVAIVFGRSLDNAEIKLLERPGAYVTIAAAYRAAARRLGIAPSTLQAITWLAWRRIKQLDDTAPF